MAESPRGWPALLLAPPLPQPARPRTVAAVTTAQTRLFPMIGPLFLTPRQPLPRRWGVRSGRIGRITLCRIGIRSDDAMPEPGWYDDPANPGLLAWWDGEAWQRQHTQPRPKPKKN